MAFSPCMPATHYTSTNQGLLLSLWNGCTWWGFSGATPPRPVALRSKSADWRYPIRWPADDDGVHLTGTMAADITQLSVDLQRGKQSITMPLVLLNDPISDAQFKRLVCVAGSALLMQHLGCTVFCPHAAAGAVARTAKRHCLVTPYTQLKLLTAEEYVEHGHECPEGHPLHETWKQLRSASDHKTEEPSTVRSGLVNIYFGAGGALGAPPPPQIRAGGGLRKGASRATC